MSSLTSHILHFVIIYSIQVARAHSTSIYRDIKTRLLYGALHSFCNRFGLRGKYNSYDLQPINYSQS